MTQPCAPTDFEGQHAFDGPGFRLEPLGPQHNEREHEAWMLGIDHIRSTPGFGSDEGWPTEMILESNLADLEMPAGHFAVRAGFTYSILDGDQFIGCVCAAGRSRRLQQAD